jgi:hypothetical protein
MLSSPLEDLELGPALVEHARDDTGDESFGQLNDVVEVGIGHLGLHHPEFGEMAASLGFLRAERRPESIHLAESHGSGLGVELPTLGQERAGVLEVLHRKQRGCSFAGRGSEDRRVTQDEAAPVEEVANAVDDLVTHAQDGRLALGPDPQVTSVEQVVHAVLFRRNRIVVRFSVDLEARHLDLESTLRA